MEKIIVIGGDFIHEPCSYCGKIKELRPYGKNGAKICFDCGMKPENIETTNNTFYSILSGDSEKINKNQLN